MDSRVDDYITNAGEFARPILIKARKAFLKASTGIEETIKWGTPCWEQSGLLAGVGAFKAHVRLSLFKGNLMEDPHNLFDQAGGGALGSIQWTDVQSMPTQAILISYIKQAIKINESGMKDPSRKGGRRDKSDLKIPAEFLEAVQANAAAWKTFDSFSYTHQREYVEWFSEAKRDSTRERRLATTIEWLSEGKSKNWKYQ